MPSEKFSPYISVERLKAYNETDAAEIGALMPHLSEKFNDAPIPKDRLCAIIESSYHEQLVARVNRRIAGTATLSLIISVNTGNKIWLEDFVTDPTSEIKGIGQALWNEMESLCRENAADIYFTSRSDRIAAHKFYGKNGASVKSTDFFVKSFKQS